MSYRKEDPAETARWEAEKAGALKKDEVRLYDKRGVLLLMIVLEPGDDHRFQWVKPHRVKRIEIIRGRESGRVSTPDGFPLAL